MPDSPSAWQAQGTREHQFGYSGPLFCWRESIQLAGFTFPNKKTLWVSSMGHQAHLNIKYFNCHISLSSLFSALNPWKLLWQLHAVYLCESRLWPTWECQSWCTEVPLHCSSRSRGTHPSTIKLEGAGEGFTCKLYSYQLIYNLRPYCIVLICYKPPPPPTGELPSLKKTEVFSDIHPDIHLFSLLEKRIAEEEW